MFFDQLDERNAMVMSVLAFDDFGQVGIADLGWIRPRKSRFLRPDYKCDDPSIFPGHLDGRNMIEESIMHFGHFWVSTESVCVVSVYDVLCNLKKTCDQLLRINF
jgi:hypothetical protein